MLLFPSPPIARAIIFAVRKHGGQLRKASLFPYVTHPVRVASLIMQYTDLSGNTLEEAMIIALLHDIIEDTSTTWDELNTMFGSHVTEGVRALTKVKHDALGNAFPRKIVFLRKLQTVVHGSIPVQCVALADRADNLNLFEPHPRFHTEEFSQYIDESQLLLETIGSASSGLADLLQSRIHIAQSSHKLLFST